MISLENWAQIRILRKQGMSIRKIAAEVGCAKKTVERALASDTPPEYKKRAPKRTAFDDVELQSRELLDEDPTIAATVIAERVGWTGSMSWFRENIRRIRPEYLPQDPVDSIVHRPGEQIQCDLMFADGGISDGYGRSSDLPVLVMVASYSRVMAARILPSKTTGDLVSGMWLLLEQHFGVVPKHLLWDHETGIGQKKLTDQVLSFSGTLGVTVKQAPPRDPETKGVVERHNEYLETSFFPARHFDDPDDAQTQLNQWIETVANHRIHATLKQRPIDRWPADAKAMAPLPPYCPQTGLRRQLRLLRNYYVSVDSNRYSVDPGAIGRLVTVIVELATVTVLDNSGGLLANHQRVWGKYLTITDPAHQEKAQAMRRGRATPRSRNTYVDMDVEAADLSIYDNLIG